MSERNILVTGVATLGRIDRPNKTKQLFHNVLGDDWTRAHFGKFLEFLSKFEKGLVKARVMKAADGFYFEVWMEHTKSEYRFTPFDIYRIYPSAENETVAIQLVVCEGFAVEEVITHGNRAWVSLHHVVKPYFPQEASTKWVAVYTPISPLVACWATIEGHDVKNALRVFCVQQITSQSLVGVREFWVVRREGNTVFDHVEVVIDPSAYTICSPGDIHVEFILGAVGEPVVMSSFGYVFGASTLGLQRQGEVFYGEGETLEVGSGIWLNLDVRGALGVPQHADARHNWWEWQPALVEQLAR